MSKRILWIDNDTVWLSTFRKSLIQEGYEVNQVLSLTRGFEELERDKYDLLILDVMMPVRTEEEGDYPSSKTNGGHKSGLVFYVKHKETLAAKGIAVFVFTIREDQQIRDDFFALGLPERCYMTKAEAGEIDVFLERVEELIAAKEATA